VRCRCEIESEEFEPATFSGLERVNGSNQFLDNYNVNPRHELGPSTNSYMQKENKTKTKTMLT
jgi:hypothetical protein